MGNTSTYQASAAMSNLWNYLRGLSLSYEDRHWLADKLIENTENKGKKNWFSRTSVKTSNRRLN